MKTLLTLLLLTIATICNAQVLDTIKELSNPNVLTLIDAKTKEMHFVFKTEGLTDAQFIEMRKNLEIALLYFRIYK